MNTKTKLGLIFAFSCYASLIGCYYPPSQVMVILPSYTNPKLVHISRSETGQFLTQLGETKSTKRYWQVALKEDQKQPDKSTSDQIMTASVPTD